MLTEMGISYIMPVETNDRVEREVKAAHDLRFRHIEWLTAFRCITDTITLIIIDSSEAMPKRKQHQEPVYWLYVTNMPVTDWNIVDICCYYADRWGIENGYRIDDHDFTGMTTSHSDAVRLSYLFLSVVFSNIWTLLKTMQSVSGEHETTAYAFSEEFKRSIIFSPMTS